MPKAFAKTSNKVDPEDDDSPRARSNTEKRFPKPKYQEQPGPTRNRSCRDILFLLLFMVYWAGMFYIASVAVKSGDPQRLIVPTDSLGQYCGRNNKLTNDSQMDLTDKPVLYFLAPWELDNSTSVCLSECPSNTTLANLTNAICNYGKTPANMTDLALAVAAGDCAPFVLESEPVLGRCIPVSPVPVEYMANLTDFNVTLGNVTLSPSAIIEAGTNLGFQVVSDLAKAWPYVLIGAGVATVLCFIWVFLLRYFAKILAWFAVIACNLLFVGLAVWLYLYHQQLAQLPVVTESDDWQLQTVQILWIVAAVIAVISILLTIALRKRIKLAIEIINEASRALAKMPTIFTLPVFQFIVFGMLTCYFIYILLYIITSATPMTIGSELNLQVSDPQLNLYLGIYHFFGYLWAWAFISGYGQVTIAGAVATYYWSVDKRNIPFWTVGKSVYRTFRYHMGSIAIGSLLLAIVRLISAALWYAQYKSKEAAKEVKAIRYIIACLQCCVRCCEMIVKFINKNAYIYIAINGQGFCKASFSAFGLIMRNATRLLTVNFISEFVLGLSSLMITTAVFFGSWEAMRVSSLELRFDFIPAVMIAIEAFAISMIFMNVYHMAIDTMLLCFLEDSERNDGSEEKPYFMSDEMRALAGKK